MISFGLVQLKTDSKSAYLVNDRRTGQIWSLSWWPVGRVNNNYNSEKYRNFVQSHSVSKDFVPVWPGVQWSIVNSIPKVKTHFSNKVEPPLSS